MRHLLRYLAIPSDYEQSEGLRWSTDGEAIETSDGRTFVITKTLPPFLEGLCAERPLIHFIYVLELLRLLGQGDTSLPGIPLRQCRAVRYAFQQSGTSYRNAGVFFGIICSAVPTAYVTLGKSRSLARWLATNPICPYPNSFMNPDVPPLELATFRHLVAVELARFTDTELCHWFRHGAGPLKEEGERLAEEIISVKPPAACGTFEELLRQRPRLAAALPLVDTMVSALSLPPRRRTPPQLPLGGYADVTNRGQPEQLLPSQFALDSDEFIRRFAEKELLFFRREEPHQRTREQLVLLVDQGVRTWGSVRLALSAAVLAFRKFAARRQLPFLLRCSVDPGQRLDPAVCAPVLLADRLEASDLSANPADLIHAELNDVDTNDADIILLTHPRSLSDTNVKAATAKLPGNKRLFALAVDDDAAALFSELRQGEALPISRFRARASRTSTTLAALPKDESVWTGDVEPVPFPFPLAPFRKIISLAFDPDGQYLMALTEQGMLHLWDLENHTLEMLPRAYQDCVFSCADTVIGVRNGFVVGGWLRRDTTVAAHYDVSRRTVKLHELLDFRAKPGTCHWFSIPEANAVAVCTANDCRGLDLNTGTTSPGPEPREGRSFAYQARMRACKDRLPFPSISVKVGPSTSKLPTDDRCLVHCVSTGELTLLHDGKLRNVRAPLSDGRNLFQEVQIVHAQLAGTTLAVCVRGRARAAMTEWHLWNIHDESWKTEFPGNPSYDATTRLSPNGRLLARHCAARQIVVDGFPKTGSPVLVTPVASVPDSVRVELGHRRMNIVFDRDVHSLSWTEGPLRHQFQRGVERVRHDMVKDTRGRLHPLIGNDPGRFFSVASRNLDVLTDVAGHVIIFDPHRNRVVCMFLTARNRFAAWMPDGTRYGPANMIGQPATPGALDRLGEALRQAESPTEI